MASQPIDQASILAGGRALVPDFLQQQLQQSLGSAQVRQADAQTNLFKQKIAEGIVATQQEEDYARAARAALDSGDPRAISKLIAMFPGKKDALKTYYDQMDGLKQRSELRQAAGIWSALNSGNTAAAIKALETRITSDREAGEDTADDEEQLAALKSGDPKAINGVKGQLGLFMASVVPDKFASVVEQLGGGNRAPKVVGYGGRLVSDDGTVLFAAPDAPFTLNDGDTRFAATGGEAPPPVPGGGDIVSAMLPITMATESNGQDYARGGGILTSSAGAQGRMQVMPGTQSDPGFGVAPARDGSMEEKARVGRDYLRAMMQRYGDPAKAWAAYNAGPGAVDAALANGGNWLQSLPGETRAYVAKNMQALSRGGQAVASAGPQPVASVPKAPATVPQGTRMTPQEVAAEGLDPQVVYYRNKFGVPEPVGGQAKLVAGQKDGAYSQSAIDAFDRAIGTAQRMKTHPGLSAAVGLKGLSGGFLGGWVVPGTDAADFGAELDAMKAQVFLPMVQTMKGMGALSNAEGEKLTASIGALSTKQSEKQFTSSLDRIIGDLNTYKKRGMGAAGGGSGAPIRVRSIQQANALPPGTLYIAPDGKTRRR